MNSTLSFLGQSNGAAGAAAGVGVIMILFVVIVIAASIFWIWMLIDCLTSTMPTSEKLLWFLVIFFLHFIGALLYFVMRRSSGGSTLAT